MREFAALFPMWFTGHYRKRGRYILSAVLLIAFICGYSGSSEYDGALTGNKDFQANESAIAANMRNYTEVSKYGISIRSVPPPNSVYFANPSVTSELHGRINTVAVFDTQNGRGEFDVGGGSMVRLRFSRLVLILLTFWAMYMTFAPTRHREYMKFLAAPCSLRNVHLSILTAAFASMTINFAAAFAASTVGTLAGGVSLQQLDFTGLLPYLAVCLLLLAFFVVLGFIASTRPSPGRAYAALFIVWLVLVFLVPPVIDAVTDKTAETVPSADSIYDDKQKIINNYEKETEEKYGKFNKEDMETERKISRNYRQEAFPKVEALDIGRGDRIVKKVALYDILSGLCITSFYKRVEAESGGRGYRDYIGFFNYLLTLRRGFLDFWIFRVYFNDPNHVVPFVKGDENLYFARGGLPSYFVWGYLFNLGVLAFILLPVSFRRFRKYLYTPGVASRRKEKNPTISMYRGTIRAMRIFRPKGESETFYNMLAGEARFNTGNGHRLSFHAEPLNSNDKKMDFVYVCHPRHIPGHIKVNRFIAFIRRLKNLSREEVKSVYAALGAGIAPQKTFDQLESTERGMVLLTVLRFFKPGVFLVDNLDVNTGMPPRFVFKLHRYFKEWAAAGSGVLYFTLDPEIKMERSRHRRDLDYLEIELWCEKVESVEALDDIT